MLAGVMHGNRSWGKWNVTCVMASTVKGDPAAGLMHEIRSWGKRNGTCVMASTVKGEPATWAPWSVMATVWRPTSDQGTATLYAPPPSASDAAIARPHPLGPAGNRNCGSSGLALAAAGLHRSHVVDSWIVNWGVKLAAEAEKKPACVHSRALP